MTFTVRLVSDGGSEGEDRFLQDNDLSESNPVYKLEGVLRISNQETQTRPDMFGLIRCDPRLERNPLLCNLKDWESQRDTTKAVMEILHSMLIKIPEYQIECSTIRGIGSHRITRFDLVETEGSKKESKQY